MLTRRLDEDDEDVLPARRTPERELTLGTGAILGIFFGLVVSWGAFFGFGYKLGSGATRTAAAASDGTGPTAAATSPNFGAFKPSAGSPLSAAGNTNTQANDGSKPVQTTPPSTVAASRSTVPQPSAAASTEPETAPAAAPVHSAPAPAPTAEPPAPAPVANGSFLVQIAAFSHQEDADLVVGALRAKGYAVSAHTEAGDKFIHVQVGPFANRNDANAMKLRLNADGYNAYIK